MSVFPTDDMALTTILVVADIGRSKAWYTDVLGATLRSFEISEYRTASPISTTR